MIAWSRVLLLIPFYLYVWVLISIPWYYILLSNLNGCKMVMYCGWWQIKGMWFCPPLCTETETFGVRTDSCLFGCGVATYYWQLSHRIAYEAVMWQFTMKCYWHCTGSLVSTSHAVLGKPMRNNISLWLRSKGNWMMTTSLQMFQFVWWDFEEHKINGYTI
jgi:hypothetical protein